MRPELKASGTSMPKSLCLGLLLLAIVGGPASAGDTSEVYIFRRCTSTSAAVAATDPACANYAYGILNVLPPNAPPRRTTCFPAVVSPAQANAIVYNYVRNHPERLAVGAARVRAEAFNSAFPCK
jgi:hypothetical protein